VIAADIIDYADPAFVAWVNRMRTFATSGGPANLIQSHEQRPNNWGTHAGAARIAADIYLGDTVDLARAVTVFRGYLGDRTAYAGFSYGDTSWQCDPKAPVAINPPCVRSGVNLDGVIPDDQRRGGSCCALKKENYVWEALQGVVVQAQLLARRGYDAWNWSGQAVRRAVNWLHAVNAYPAAGDDTWMPWLINKAYRTTFPAPSPTGMGKNMSYTDYAR
jgi:hypothetical protein